MTRITELKKIMTWADAEFNAGRMTDDEREQVCDEATDFEDAQRLLRFIRNEISEDEYLQR